MMEKCCIDCDHRKAHPDGPPGICMNCGELATSCLWIISQWGIFIEKLLKKIEEGWIP